MTTIALIGTVMLLLLVVIALSYRSYAQQAMHYGALQKTIADAALSQVRQRHSLDTALETIQETHREETVHANDPTHLAERSDFDNDWSGDAGLHDTGAGADHPDSTAAAAEPGVALDHRRRADLS